MPPSDAYLESITIGERKPLNGSIEISQYNTEWPALFDLAAARVTKALDDRVRLLEHVGSTSVPGLAAKPIIDMLLAVDDSAQELAYVPRLEGQGYVLRIRETEWFEHRLLLLTEGTQVWQLHVFSEGCEEIDRMLKFRDRLRTNEEDRIL